MTLHCSSKNSHLCRTNSCCCCESITCTCLIILTPRSVRLVVDGWRPICGSGDTFVVPCTFWSPDPTVWSVAGGAHGKLATWEKLQRNKRNMRRDLKSISINLPCMLLLFFRLEPWIRSSLIHQAFIKFTRCTIVDPSSDRWEFQEQGPIFPCKTWLGPWFDRSLECSGNTELWQVWAMELEGWWDDEEEDGGGSSGSGCGDDVVMMMVIGVKLFCSGKDANLLAMPVPCAQIASCTETPQLPHGLVPIVMIQVFIQLTYWYFLGSKNHTTFIWIWATCSPRGTKYTAILPRAGLRFSETRAMSSAEKPLDLPCSARQLEMVMMYKRYPHNIIVQSFKQAEWKFMMRWQCLSWKTKRQRWAMQLTY